jgi:hypothetical protein
MAIGLTTPEPTANRTDRFANRPDGISTGDVPLFRFGLRQLLLFVAVTCALLAAVVSTNGLFALVIIVATAVVAMHVFATALGTQLQLRMEKDRQRANQSQINESPTSASEQSAKLQAIRLAPRSPWHGRSGTYLPWLSRLVVGAMFVGALGGAVSLSGVIGDRASLEGIIVGAASFAVLAGWISFLGGNFYGVFRDGFRDALSEQRKDQTTEK